MNSIRGLRSAPALACSALLTLSLLTPGCTSTELEVSDNRGGAGGSGETGGTAGTGGVGGTGGNCGTAGTGGIGGTGGTGGTGTEPGVPVLIDVARDGRRPDGDSWLGDISADGRFVAFYSEAGNLVAGDSNNDSDVFVYDATSKATERVSVTASGGQARGNSTAPRISADGRFVAFESTAPNLVPGDSNGMRDVFVFDRQTRQVERVSVSTAGAEGAGAGRLVALSGNGRFVAFHAESLDSVQGFFIRDRETAATEFVAASDDPQSPEAGEVRGAFSFDGRLLAFNSGNEYLLEFDGNDAWDVLIFDRTSRGFRAGGFTYTGATPRRGAALLSMSADGRYVVFSGEGSVVPDGEYDWGAYVSDLATGEVTPTGFEGGPLVVSSSGSGRILASGYLDSSLRLLDRSTGARRDIPVGVTDGPDRYVGLLGSLLSSDGRYIAYNIQGEAELDGIVHSPLRIFLVSTGWSE